jgi:PAS domain S-box-containing protein
MLDRIRKGLRPPVFEDEDKTRAARLLNTILLTTLALSMVFGVVIVTVSSRAVVSLVVTGILVLLQVGTLFLARRGHVQLASTWLVSVLWAIVTLGALTAGGVRSASFSTFTVIIVIAGLLSGGRAGLGFAGLSTVAGLGILYAETKGILPPPLLPPTSVSTWLVQTMLFLLTAVLLHLATRSINNALDLARRNERALAESNRELETEIAERVRAEEALQESERRYRQIVEGASDVVYTTGPQGHFTYVNPLGLKLTGYSEDELIGMHFTDLIPSDWKRRVQLFYQRQFRERMRETMLEVPILTRAGEKKWVEQSVTLLTEGDRGTGFQSIVRDITARVRVEEARQESERRHRALFERTNDAIFIVSLEGIVLMVNQQAADMLGYTTDELMGMRFEQILAPGEYPNGQIKLATLQAGQSLPIYERIYRRKDGVEVPAEINAALVYDSTGKPVHIQSIVRDITERKRAEAERERLLAELKYRSTQLQTAAEVSKSASTILDPEELMDQAVTLIQERFGFYYAGLFLLDQAGEWAVLRAGTGQAGQKMLKAGHRLAAGGESMIGQCVASAKVRLSLDVEKEAIRFDNPLLPETRSEMALPLISRGQCIGALTVQSIEKSSFPDQDTTALQTMADQLAVAIENARLYEETYGRARRLAVVNRIGGAVGTTLNLDDLMETVYQEVAPVFEADAFFIALYDRETNELDFRIQVDEGIREPRTREPLDTGLTSLVVTTRKPLLIGNLEQEQEHLPLPELWGTMKQPGSWLGVPMLISGWLTGVISVQAYRPHVYGEEEQLLLSTIADQVAIAVERARLHQEIQQELAERERLEAQLVQAQKMEAIGRLAGGVAHDFNNLLTAITGYTSLLLSESGVDDPARADLEEIKKAADRAASLTDQLLAFSRKKMLQPKVLDLNAVVADVERMLRRLIGEDIDLVTLLDPTLGRVKADPGQIQQVVMNLAVNARDAMPQGGQLTLETMNVDLDEAHAQQHVDLQPGSYVMLAVSDTGVGMDKETQDHLFEPFFTTKEIGKGTGLGLATIYGIVKQSGGGIYVYSEPGQGTTFKIYLPRIEEAVDLPRPDAGRIRLPQGSETVLLVEDEDMVRELARRILQRSGYTVLEARQARDAIAICARHETPIQLLITDVVMPGGMSGRDLAEHLATSRPEMQVLYISGYTDDAIVRHGMLDEGVAFLQKPFTPDALARKVRQVLDVSRQE